MKKPVILITGCDANYFHFLKETIVSCERAMGSRLPDVGILDLGLAPEHRDWLSARGCTLVIPEWTLPVPESLRKKHELGLIARTALRDYFPGYQVYLWFDADAWAQTPEFLDVYIDGAKANGAAVALEPIPMLARGYLYNRWWFGHMISAFGPIKGASVAARKTMNIGLVALTDTAPLWDSWAKHYVHMIERTKRVNIDQHAFNAAVYLDHIPTTFVPFRNNWIPLLVAPIWDAERKLLCEPQSGTPLSVIHLAGPNKKRTYSLQSRPDGALFVSPLSFDAIHADALASAE